MGNRGILRFVVVYTLLGLVVAAIILWLMSGTSLSLRPAVEIRQSMPASTSSAPAPSSYAAAVQRAAPAVVNIYTSKRRDDASHPLFDSPLFKRFFDEQHPERRDTETSLGSGVLVSEQGHILTNHHVVADATAIQVRLADGRRAAAALVGTDPETDIAVLRIGLRPLPRITTGRSNALTVGDVVLAIGNPFGVGQTVTQGIVSATGRNQLGLTTFEDFIQTDAAINPGNSGGALVNADGELIGINTAIYSRSGGSMGIGFAIPVDLARDVMAEIVETGEVTRGWLGIEIQPLDAARGPASREGVRVADVYKSGPAAEAGIRAGDIIKTVNGKAIQGPRQLRQRVTKLDPGDTISVALRRDGDRVTRELTVARRPAPTRRRSRDRD